MVSVMTDEEYQTLREKLKKTQESVIGNRQEALRLLKEIGIVDDQGDLTQPYQILKSK